jgi:hypothetical protein
VKNTGQQTVNAVLYSRILSTLKKEATRSYETSVQYLHGATCQKTAFFIVTAVRTSNPSQEVVYMKPFSGIA